MEVRVARSVLHGLSWIESVFLSYGVAAGNLFRLHLLILV